MGRRYITPLNGVAVSAVADLLYIKPPAGAAVKILEIAITQDDSETSEQLALQIHRTSTDNSAQGTGMTPAPLDERDAAAEATVRSNITGGSLSAETTLLWRSGQNILSGWHWLPTPEAQIVLGPGGNGLAVKLDAAPAAAIDISGYMIHEEIG